MAQEKVSETFNIHVRDENGKSIKGTLTLSGHLHDLLSQRTKNNRPENTSDNNSILLTARTNMTSLSDLNSISDDTADYDSSGASMFVIAVVLLYGFSIVLLIASHVFIKRKAHHHDSDKIIDQYLDQAAVLRRENSREAFARLKMSLMPMIARSPSGRDMIAKRVKYTPFLLQYIPMTAISGSNVNAFHIAQTPTRDSVLPETTLNPIPEHVEPVAQEREYTTIEHHPDIHVDAQNDSDSAEPTSSISIPDLDPEQNLEYVDIGESVNNNTTTLDQGIDLVCDSNLNSKYRGQ